MFKFDFCANLIEYLSKKKNNVIMRGPEFSVKSAGPYSGRLTGNNGIKSKNIDIRSDYFGHFGNPVKIIKAVQDKIKI